MTRTLCVNTTDDASCAALLPDFWTAIATELYPVAWSHICDDIAVRFRNNSSNNFSCCQDTCAAHGPQRPTCEACSLRVKWTMEYLKDPAVQDWWMETLSSGSFCAGNYSGLEDLCGSYLDLLLRDMLTLTAVNFWVDGWCQNMFGCHH